MKTVQDPTFIAKMVKAYPKLFASLPTKDSGIKYQLEGYLFPATYDYTKSSTVESVIENMIQAANTPVSYTHLDVYKRQYWTCKNQISQR